MQTIRTVVKFYRNPHEGNRNHVITRTLMKVAVIDDSWKGPIQPADGEFWLVEILRETCPGQNKGCFLLAPISKIESKDVSKLIPGMYSEEFVSGILHVRPNTSGLTNPILPLKHKKNIKNVYAIIVHA